MSWILKIKEEPISGTSERKAVGKWNSRCKGPEAGPAGKIGECQEWKESQSKIRTRDGVG